MKIKGGRFIRLTENKKLIVLNAAFIVSIRASRTFKDIEASRGEIWQIEIFTRTRSHEDDKEYKTQQAAENAILQLTDEMEDGLNGVKEYESTGPK